MSDPIRTFERIAQSSAQFENFIQSFHNLPCTHFWKGYGSAMFIEFGTLHDRGFRRDGSKRNPKGEWTLQIEWSWRIEGRKLIWCGSWSDEEKWLPTFSRLLKTTVTSVNFWVRLPEIEVGFSNGLHLVSMMTAEGDPQWSLSKRCSTGYDGLSSRLGSLVLETYRDAIDA